MEAEVLIERHGAVALITLNAPERRNALTLETADALITACDAVDTDDEVGAVVIRGAGGSFCAGADRSLLAGAGSDPAADENYRALGRIYESFIRVGELRAPTVAAVRGSAVGAGMNLLLITDLRVIAHDARLLSGFATIGLHPGGGHYTMLHRLAGREAAAAISVFGEEIDGMRAQQLGLAWDAVPDGEVEDRALELAAAAAADPALARAAVASFRAEGMQGVPLPVAVAFERSSQMWSLRRRSS